MKDTWRLYWREAVGAALVFVTRILTAPKTPWENDEFLFAEGVISSRDDVGRVSHCGRPDQEGYGNTIDVVPGPGVSLDIDRLSATRRGTLTTSACGVCGRRSVDDVIARCAPLPVARGAIAPATILNAVDGLRSRQPNFARTGGIHGAAMHDAEGNVLSAFEDIDSTKRAGRAEAERRQPARERLFRPLP